MKRHYALRAACWLYVLAMLSANAVSCYRIIEQPCNGVTDPRYSCRAVPDLRPEPVKAIRR